MRKSCLLYTALGLIVILGALHFIAEAFYFYWILWWYDIMMHMLAGFSGGLLVVWFFRPASTFKSILITVVCVMIVGIIWEVFEYVYGLTQTIDYWQDTILDLILDGTGATLACFYASEETQESSLRSQDV